MMALQSAAFSFHSISIHSTKMSYVVGRTLVRSNGAWEAESERTHIQLFLELVHPLVECCDSATGEVRFHTFKDLRAVDV